MSQLLPYFATIPLLGFFLSLLPKNRQEKLIFGISIGTVLVHAVLLLGFFALWAGSGFPDTHWEGLDLYATSEEHFSIDFFFDRTTAAYFSVTVILTFMVMVFSRYYIHREKGFRRFFNNILFFYSGLTLILFSGNFETMFVGWEIIGVTSFFLIAFYRDRYLPVKNALKVVSLYRVADVFLLFGVWVCHHYFHRSVMFVELKNMMAQQTPILTESPYIMGIPLTFLVVAMVKSAQLPFSSWLPRAMEGPTTSSAIFYGSLSVHIGIFLLIRTYPLWEGNVLFEILLVAIGLSTSVVATLIARVQSTVKTQIAYSSIAQIGIMFVEVALGWHGFALFHFASNAFLRTYQLLVSPSVLSYQIHDQFFNFIPPQHQVSNTLWARIRLSIYMLGIKEWNLDTLMYRWLWTPLKQVGNILSFISAKSAMWLFLPLYSAGTYLAYHRERMPDYVTGWMPVVLALVGLLLILKSFVKRNDAANSWILVIVSQLFISLAISFNEQFDVRQIYLYLSGILISGGIGYWCFQVLKKAKESTMLDRFHGHSYEHPRLANLFMVACLGIMGFPITPTFIGEDLILGHIHENQFILASFIALSLILDGLAVFRIYARLFLGPHDKTYHEIAYRSS